MKQEEILQRQAVRDERIKAIKQRKFEEEMMAQ